MNVLLEIGIYFYFLSFYFRLSEAPLVSAKRQWFVRTGTSKNILVSALRLNLLMPVLELGVTLTLMT